MLSSMKRLWCCLLAVVVLAAVPVSAGAVGTKRLHSLSTGAVVGTREYEFVPPPCLDQYTDRTSVTVDRGHRSGTLTMNVCSIPRRNGSDLTGTFTLAMGKNTLSGTVTGTDDVDFTRTCPQSYLIPLAIRYQLEVESGVGWFKNAGGTMTLAGTWCSPGQVRTPGPIIGNLT